MHLRGDRSGSERSTGIQMLIDVGTNAEIVLGNCEWLLACAGAAGPALEGGVVERGMQAAAGAVDKVRIDRKTLDPDFRVIGGGKASGICGSGLIELVAEMFSSKILNIQGKFSTGLICSRLETPRTARLMRWLFLLRPATEARCSYLRSTSEFF